MKVKGLKGIVIILAGLASLITPACNRSRVEAGNWEMKARNGECLQLAIKNQRASAIGKNFDEFVLQELFALDGPAPCDPLVPDMMKHFANRLPEESVRGESM